MALFMWSTRPWVIQLSLAPQATSRPNLSLTIHHTPIAKPSPLPLKDRKHLRFIISLLFCLHLAHLFKSQLEKVLFPGTLPFSLRVRQLVVLWCGLQSCISFTPVPYLITSFWNHVTDGKNIPVKVSINLSGKMILSFVSMYTIYVNQYIHIDLESVFAGSIWGAQLTCIPLTLMKR